MKRRLLFLAPLAAVLLACSPVEIVTYQWKQGNTTFVQTRAKSGPSDNAGSSFRSAVVCDGEPFWRRGNDVSVDTATPDAGGFFYSTTACYDNRVPVGITVERW
ncbi:MAG: hypothetical protein K0Q89_112 [Thermomicrobiales bacterium]|nr:hypothetical protein [Thermomicrobiales bacterium]